MGYFEKKKAKLIKEVTTITDCVWKKNQAF